MSSLLAGNIAVVTVRVRASVGRLPSASPAKGRVSSLRYHEQPVEAGPDARYHYPSGRRGFFQKTTSGAGTTSTR